MIRWGDGQTFIQRIVEAVPSLIYVIDIRQRKIVFLNRDIGAALGDASVRDPKDAEFIPSLLHPDDWHRFLDYLQRLADLRDETEKFEFRVRDSNGRWRWFRSRDRVFTRNEDGSVREIIGTATDSTESKSAEERAMFMADLNQAILPLADPGQITSAAVRMLGEYLAVDRCAYAEVEADEDHFVIMGNYTRGQMASIVGRYRMSDFGDRERKVLRENRPYVVNDIVAESPPGTDLSPYELGGLRSFVCVPLNKDGNFVARMAVHQSTPRKWSEAEIDLVTKVANRCWEAVERARAVRRLKDSDDRYRAFVANSSEAIWCYEFEQPIPLDLPAGEQIEMLFKHAYLAECNDAMARMYGYDKADQITGARLGDLLVPSDPQNIASLHAIRNAGYRLTDFESHEVDRYGNSKYFLNNLIAIQENGALVRCWGTQRDITEQKRAGEALRASEERLRRITDATQDALWEIDLKTKQLWWSEGARPLFGRGPGELEIGLEDWYDRIHPEDVARVRIKFEQFMNGDGSDWFDEYRFRRADGNYAYIYDQGRKFRDESGMQVRIAGAMVDITKRKAAEAAVMESEKRFEKAFKASPDSLVISRLADGVVLEVNDSFVSLTGYRPDEIVGKSTVSLGIYHDPSDRQRAMTIMKEQNRVRDFELLMRRKSGEVRLILFSAEPLELHGEHCWLTIGRDITERKQAEEARRRSEEEARRQLAYVEAIYATAPVGLCFVDTDLRFRSINTRLAEMNGKPVEDHLGRTLREVVPDIADTIEPRYRRVIETGEAVLNLELSAAGKRGTLQHYDVSYYPIKDDKGHVLGVNVVVVDITQRKQVEEDRERLLEQETAAREEAEGANRMKDEFLATISHELRTPLTSILGWAHMLIENSLQESQRRHALDVIERSAKSQKELIDNMLDTSRIITGRLKLDARPVEIEQILLAAVDVIRPSAEAKGIDLQVLIDDHGSLVFGDANRLQQVIWNLLANAVKFTNPDGRIKTRLIRDGNQIEIYVHDTGIGIEPHFLPYVFDRFRQADSTSTRRYGGLGLGLAIVRHVVEMHGGSVAAWSPGKGQGSTFKVRLPVASPRRQAKSEPEPASKEASAHTELQKCGTLTGLRVLVVEDDPDTLDLLRFILENCGASITAAASASEALDVLERWQPDALVSDLAMPVQDGFELIAKVRSRGPERGGNIPAVALTAYTRAEDRTRALAAGFQIHVSKPVDPQELVSVLVSLLR